MNIIYLHGFQSNSNSIKGQQLKQYCAQHRPNDVVHLPDLNMHPQQALDLVSRDIERLSDVVLVGSSMGGFYATQLVAKHGIPAVLINPAMRPWHLFRTLFATTALPYAVTADWSLDEAQLDHLEYISVPFVQDANTILVLLQQGDEVLDYREAQRYYSEASQGAMLMIESHGSHAMHDFADKIPAVLQFLSDSIK